MEETKQLAELTAAQFWFILFPIAMVFVIFCGYLLIKLYQLYQWAGDYLIDENNEHPTINKVLLFPFFLVLMAIWMIIAVTIMGLIAMFIAKLIRSLLGLENG